MYLHGVVRDKLTFTFYQLYATFIRKMFKLDLVSHFVDLADAIVIDQMRQLGRTRS